MVVLLTLVGVVMIVAFGFVFVGVVVIIAFGFVFVGVVVIVALVIMVPVVVGVLSFEIRVVGGVDDVLGLDFGHSVVHGSLEVGQVQDKVRFRHRRHLAGGELQVVRVRAGRSQRGHGDVVPADVGSGVLKRVERRGDRDGTAVFAVVTAGWAVLVG